MLRYYIAISAVIFLLLCLAENPKAGLPNFILKIVLGLMGGWALIIIILDILSK